MRRLNKGFIVGALSAVSQFNVPVLGPIVVGSAFSMLKFRKPPSSDAVLVNLLVLKIAWMIGIQVTIGQLGLNQMMIYLLGDIIILSFLYVRANQSFVVGFFRASYLLFLVDFMFNLMVKFTGSDPFGRTSSLRVGDEISRVGGIFDHAFVSVQIAVVAFIAGVVLQKRWMLFLASIGLLINGTLRAPLSLVLLALLLFLIWKKPKFIAMVFVLTAFALCVFGITAWSAASADHVSGNVLRVFAWTNALTQINDNMFFGSHNFVLGDFESMSFETILDYGIAESYYFDTWLRFGFFAPLTSVFIFWIFFRRGIEDFRFATNDPILKAKILVVSFTYCDLFYGNFFGTVLTSSTFALLASSYESEKIYNAGSAT